MKSVCRNFRNLETQLCRQISSQLEEQLKYQLRDQLWKQLGNRPHGWPTKQSFGGETISHLHNQLINQLKK